MYNSWAPRSRRAWVEPNYLGMFNYLGMTPTVLLNCPIKAEISPYQTICILKLILKYLKCIFSIWTLFSCILILFDKKI